MSHYTAKITRPTFLLKQKARAHGVCAGKAQNQTLLTHSILQTHARDRLASLVNAQVAAKNKVSLAL